MFRAEKLRCHLGSSCYLPILAVFFWVILHPLLQKLKLTWNLKMDGWEKTFILRWPVFRGYGYGSFRECNCTTRIQWKVHPRKLTWNLKMDGFSQKEISSSIGVHFQLQPLVFGDVLWVFFFVALHGVTP